MQGYEKAEDREGLTNWMREDESELHPRDIDERDACLVIADVAIQAAEGKGKILGYVIPGHPHPYPPEDITIVREGKS